MFTVELFDYSGFKLERKSIHIISLGKFVGKYDQDSAVKIYNFVVIHLFVVFKLNENRASCITQWYL